MDFNLTQFFWRCAGVDPAEVQFWEHRMQRKYSIFGWFVVMSGVVAGISGFLAFLTVFKSIIGSFFFSIFFGLVVFNLYRFVVVNIGYRLGMGRNKREQFVSALPRIYMAFIMGFVISKPLELFIFSPLISEYSQDYADELYQKQAELIEVKFQDINDKEAQKADLEAEIDQKQAKVQEITAQLLDSTTVTDALLFEELQKRLILAKSELEETKLKNGKSIAELDKEISQRNELKSLELAQSKEKVQASFSLLNQLTVLHEYVPKTWFLTTLVVLFYVLPVLGKIKFSSDDYALVYYFNEKGEWLGNKFKANYLQTKKLEQAEEVEEVDSELETAQSEEENTEAKPYKKRPKLGFVRITMLVVGLIILIGELNQRNIFTDMLSVMLVLTAVLGWMKIIEREIATLAMIFFTIIGSFAIFLMHSGHPYLGVILGIIVLLTFGILLIGSILPIMRALYTLGVFLFLVLAISFTIHSMLRTGQEEQLHPPVEEHERVDKTDSLRVGTDSTTAEIMISHLRHWQDLHKNDYIGKLEVLEKDYQKAKQNKSDYSAKPYERSAEFWNQLYGYLNEHDSKELDRIASMFDSIRVARKLNSLDFAEAVVTCVQDIPYTLLAQKSCDAFKNDPRFAEIFAEFGCVDYVEYGINSPTEFAYSLKGDCDTRTLFLHTLLSRLGYKTAILNSEKYEHSVLGIAIPAIGKFKKHKGTKYFLWETTAKGWQIGNLSPEMNDLKHWEFVLVN